MFDNEWLSKVLAMEKLAESGHGQRPEDHNLGLGWLYYGLVRAMRVKHAVVIGSWRGFVPIVLAKAMKDNAEGGVVTFIDPSLADDHWANPEKSFRYFQEFGVTAHLSHYSMTSEEFIKSPMFEMIPDGHVDLLFLDGRHESQQVAMEHEAFIPKLKVGAPVLFHDSRSRQMSTVYEEPYLHTVYQYIEKLRSAGMAVTEFDVGPGLAMVQTKPLPPADS